MIIQTDPEVSTVPPDAGNSQELVVEASSLAVSCAATARCNEPFPTRCVLPHRHRRTRAVHGDRGRSPAAAGARRQEDADRERPMAIDDVTLVQRCRQGDDLAWEQLVRRCQGRVYGLAYHYLGSASRTPATLPRRRSCASIDSLDPSRVTGSWRGCCASRATCASTSFAAAQRVRRWRTCGPTSTTGRCRRGRRRIRSRRGWPTRASASFKRRSSA